MKDRNHTKELTYMIRNIKYSRNITLAKPIQCTSNQKHCLLGGTAIPAGPIAHYHKRTHFLTLKPRHYGAIEVFYYYYYYYTRCSENHKKSNNKQCNEHLSQTH